jgi:hypothetical protein
MTYNIVGGIQLTPRTTTPTAAKGVLYYDSGNDQLAVSVNGTSFTPIVNAGGSAILANNTASTIQSPVAKILHHYPFNSNSTDAVSAGYYINGVFPLDGTDTDITYVAGKISNAASFNSTTSHIDFGFTRTGMANAFSISCWVKYNNAASATNGFIFDSGYTSANNRIYLFRNSSGKMRGGVGDPSGNSYSTIGNTTIGSGTWVNVIITWNGSVMKLYINGVEDTPYSTSSSGTTVHTDSNGYIIMGNSPFATTNWLDGLLDDFRIYNNTLTQNDVNFIYNSGSGTASEISTSNIMNLINNGNGGVPLAITQNYQGQGLQITNSAGSYSIYVNETNPIQGNGGIYLNKLNHLGYGEYIYAGSTPVLAPHRYAFNNALTDGSFQTSPINGSTFYQEAGYGGSYGPLKHHYILNANSNDSRGQSAAINGTDTSISYVAGKISNCASFNGSSSKIVLGPTTFDFANTWAISMWVKFNAVNVIQNMLSCTSPNYIRCGLDASGHLEFVNNDSSGSTIKYYTGTSVLTTATWYHVVWTWDGTNAKIYLNGVEESYTKGTDASGAMTNSSRTFYLGCNNNATGAWLNGYLDDVRLLGYSGAYSPSMSRDEILLLYNGGSGTESEILYGTGQQGGASSAVFCGWNSSVSLGSSTWFTNAWSIGGWFKAPIADTGGNNICDVNGASANNRIFLTLSGGSVATAYLYDSTGTNSKGYYGATQITAGTWVHYVATWDGTNLKLYINGMEDTPYNKITDQAVTQTNTSRRFVIGAGYYGNGPFGGLIEDFRIYDTALSASNIALWFNGNVVNDREIGGIFSMQVGPNAGLSQTFQFYRNAVQTSSRVFSITNANTEDQQQCFEIDNYAKYGNIYSVSRNAASTVIHASFQDISLGAGVNQISVLQGGDSSRLGLEVMRNLGSANTGAPICYFHQDHSGDDQPVVTLSQAATAVAVMKFTVTDKGTGHTVVGGSMQIDINGNTKYINFYN